MSKSVLPMFSSRNLMISVLIFRSLNHFGPLFACTVRECSKLIILCITVQVPWHHRLKRLSIIHCTFFPPLLQIDHCLVGFLFGLSILTCVSDFVPIPCCFVYCHFIVQSEVWVGYNSSFFFYLKSSLAFWGLFKLYINFRII